MIKNLYILQKIICIILLLQSYVFCTKPINGFFNINNISNILNNFVSFTCYFDDTFDITQDTITDIKFNGQFLIISCDTIKIDVFQSIKVTYLKINVYSIDFVPKDINEIKIFYNRKELNLYAVQNYDHLEEIKKLSQSFYKNMVLEVNSMKINQEWFAINKICFVLVVKNDINGIYINSNSYKMCEKDKKRFLTVTCNDKFKDIKQYFVLVSNDGILYKVSSIKKYHHSIIYEIVRGIIIVIFFLSCLVGYKYYKK